MSYSTKKSVVGQGQYLSFDELKRRVTLTQAVDWFKQQNPDKPIYSNKPDEVRFGHSGSLSITDKNGLVEFIDFDNDKTKPRKSGSIIDLVMYQTGVNKQLAAHIVSEDILSQTSPVIPEEKRKKVEKPKVDKGAAYDDFMSKHWEQLKGGLKSGEFLHLCEVRGIHADMSTLQNIGYTSDGIKAYMKGVKNIEPHSLVVRNPIDKTMKAIQFDLTTGSRCGAPYQIGNCVWMPWDEMPEGDLLCLCEGEFDALALISIGVHALPCKPDKDKNGSKIKEFSHSHRLILAYDNDEAGRGYTADTLKIAPDSVDISGLWSGAGWSDKADPNDFVRGYGDDAKKMIMNEIATKDDIKPKEDSSIVLVNENQKLQQAVNAMNSCRKPVLQKDGSTKLEFERGDIAPICAFLKARGVYKELFTLDNGLRTANGEELTGEILTGEQLIMQVYGLPAMGVCAPRLCMQAARYVCEQNQKDSLRQFVEELPVWDGVDRISEFWQTYAGAIADNETERQYLKSVARYMFTAIIGRALATREKPCKADMAIILEGSTGIGKTSLVKALCARKDWYQTLSLDLPEDEYKRALRMTQFVEIGEMGEPNNKQLQAIKRILSSELLSMRKKGVDDFFYFPVRAFTIATIDQTDVLNDGAGARRWLPVRANGVVRDKKDGHLYIDCDGIKRDLKQLYAQGKAIYEKSGVVWNEINKDVQKMHTDSLTVTDARATTILNWMRTQKKTSAKLEEIALDCIGYTRERFGMKEQKELARSLALSGFVKKVMWLSGKTEKRWTHPDLNDKNDEYFD